MFLIAVAPGTLWGSPGESSNFGPIAIAVTFKNKWHFHSLADSRNRKTHHTIVPTWFELNDVCTSEALLRRISWAVEAPQA